MNKQQDREITKEVLPEYMPGLQKYEVSVILKKSLQMSDKDGNHY